MKEIKDELKIDTVILFSSVLLVCLLLPLYHLCCFALCDSIPFDT